VVAARVPHFSNTSRGFLSSFSSKMLNAFEILIDEVPRLNEDARLMKEKQRTFFIKNTSKWQHSIYLESPGICANNTSKQEGTKTQTFRSAGNLCTFSPFSVAVCTSRMSLLLICRLLRN